MLCEEDLWHVELACLLLYLSEVSLDEGVSLNDKNVNVSTGNLLPRFTQNVALFYDLRLDLTCS